MTTKEFYRMSISKWGTHMNRNDKVVVSNEGWRVYFYNQCIAQYVHGQGLTLFLEGYSRSTTRRHKLLRQLANLKED